MPDEDQNVVQFHHKAPDPVETGDNFLLEEGFDLLADFRRLSPPLRKQIAGLICALLIDHGDTPASNIA